MIPYGRQNITQADIDSVIQILKSDFITQGPTIDQFEKTVSEYCGSQYALAVSNATAALHIACLALEVGAGDEVWTSPNTFVASANCALYCGAKIGFVDINPKTYNMDVDKLRLKLIEARNKNRLPKVVIPVHFAGQSCDMEEISELSKQYGFKIIEDGSHAIGGKYLGQFIGNCKYSDITVFSFHPVKIITTGEGGMLTTNSKHLHEKLSLLRSHGISRNPDLMVSESEGGWYYQQLELGFNYRMTDIQAALGISQFARLESFIEKRHRIAENYDKLLDGLPVVTPYRSPGVNSALHLYPIKLSKDAKIGRKQFFDELRRLGVGVQVHYIPVHRQPYYQKLGFKLGDFPEAEEYYESVVSLPIYYDLTHEEQLYVVEMIRNLLLK
ncbi:UDP-4-keto-6-deoxy-N-acetylglucosamine 4-aminotransferase [Leptospira fainei serovar Hurstbridge str. BUT 6]|uniref:UDP-4-keto-6-deoxy-N-acetylglucosamine 4-aminotransferase n=1 Tax=Leptospira fainei serovar Hurstbridge str. BUT 6 TaxID=1193011 RepID=S3V0H2_9LEPT|nr:UDP-4-amino-4,6-dideoxy-N-acetyl-beta-L-altrosamine transaminase [Leptospira fainei]EPG76181.1 UDP-4-keto-6-deoxy-N-acetylglucosamine 4-aminotransferase [Leptospira fainei serovar Hurstbridge str. BUT 6]